LLFIKYSVTYFDVVSGWAKRSTPLIPGAISLKSPSITAATLIVWLTGSILPLMRVILAGYDLPVSSSAISNL
jgi:hypothetical protein